MQPINFQGLGNSQESTVHIYHEQKTQAEALKKKEDELMVAAKGFESIMVSSMMKQGMKTAREISKDDGEGSNQYMDMAYDQLAKYMGENMNLGLADSIYQNLKSRL